MMLKAVLFDFGGTLDSDGIHWVDRFRAAYEAAGYSYGPEAFNPAYSESDRRILAEHDMRGKPLRDLLVLQAGLIHEILGIGAGGGAEEVGIVEAFKTEITRYLERNRGILANLRKNYRLGVVSNFCGNLDVIFRDFGLAEHLSAIIDSCIVGVEKPDPAIFRIALERIGAEAGETVFVGDNLDRDIRPAKALGMRTVWIRGADRPTAHDSQEADRTIGSLTELEDVL